MMSILFHDLGSDSFPVFVSSLHPEYAEGEEVIVVLLELV